MRRYALYQVPVLVEGVVMRSGLEMRSGDESHAHGTYTLVKGTNRGHKRDMEKTIEAMSHNQAHITLWLCSPRSRHGFQIVFRLVPPLIDCRSFRATLKNMS